MFYGLVGIGAYTRVVSEGGTYNPVCVQLVFGMWIPRMLRVVKVGVKVDFKQTSSATEPSPFSTMGPGTGQVKTKTWTNSQVNLSVLCRGMKSTLSYHMPSKQDTNHRNNNGQAQLV